MPEKPQKRAFWRKDVELPMAFRILQENEAELPAFSSACKIINISGNGFLFLNDYPLDSNAILDTALILKRSRNPLRILCQVVRTLNQREDGLFPIAVTYSIITPSIQDQIIKDIFEEERREELLQG